MPLPRIYSSRINATIVIPNKNNIKVASINPTITPPDNIISAISALFIGKKDATPRSILSRNRTIKRRDLSQETSADLTPSHLTLAGALIRAMNSILLGLRVILITTLKTLLVPYLLTIIIIITLLI
jgi:hypothetical protein